MAHLFYVAYHGIGMAGIGMCIMHDANHGAYSKYPRLNKILGYTMNLIGANANNWKIQHNVLHHTYTNIAEVDEDLNTPSLLRFAPSKDYRKIHRFQHLYAWFFYGILSLNWVTFKDFKQMRRYRTMGLLNKGKSNTKNLIDLLIWKLIYYSYIIVIPLIVLPTPWWLVVLGFVSLHFVTGSVLSIIFQAAHVMPDIQFPLPNEEGNIDNNWTVHQLLTTTNFASKSKVFSWMIGGLNYQVEHHLFSNICHVHYPRISKIVAETAKEYGVPYNMEGSFVRVIGKHIQLLKDLGRSQDYLKMA